MIGGVRYYSFLGTCGYGEAALVYMECLLAQGIPLRWSPLISTRWGLAPWHMLPDHMRPSEDDIASSLHNSADLMPCLELDIDYDTVFLHTIPEPWPKLVESDKVNIGYTVWETDRLPAHWPEVLSSVDHLCVPCEFNRDIFTYSQGVDVSVVPHAVHRFLQPATEQECRAFRQEHDIPDNMYIFYLISTWDPRKAMSETLHAFLKTFDADDNVCLLIKTDEEGCYDHDGNKRATREMTDAIIDSYPDPAKVVLIAGRISDQQIHLIHEAGDCFFSLTHSEGWGLGAFDAAASGNPVIITGWGGQLDYLPVESSYHVKYELRHLQETIGWESYNKCQQWAYADSDDAGKILRHCYNNQLEAKEKGMKLKTFVNDHFSVKQVTPKLLRAIKNAHTG